MLGVAYADLPYGYYQFLRIVVTAACIWLAIRCQSVGFQFGTYSFGMLAILYNPIAKIQMERETHEVVNLATIAVFATFWLKQSQWIANTANQEDSP